jgi:hypothetical protein
MRYLHFILAVIVVLLPLMFSNINAAPPEDCLKMIWPNDPTSKYDSTIAGWYSSCSYNPDSVRVDSCLDSPTYRKTFAKRYFSLQLSPYFYPFDKILDSGDVKAISDISSSKINFKQQMQELEQKFGKLFFKGISGNYPDSNHYQNPNFRLFFEDLQNTEEILSYIKNNIDTVKKIIYANRAKQLTDVDDNITLNQMEIKPNPSQNKIIITIEDFIPNEQIKIYSMNGFLVRNSVYQSEINISDLPIGVYFLKYGNQIGKFIKE